MSGRGAQLAALEEKGGRYVDSGIGPSTKRKEKELRARQGDDEILQANRHRKRRARSEQKDRGEKGKDLWNFVKPDSNHPSPVCGTTTTFLFFSLLRCSCCPVLSGHGGLSTSRPTPCPLLLLLSLFPLLGLLVGFRAGHDTGRVGDWPSGGDVQRTTAN
jgi:hypothetical protein